MELQLKQRQIDCLKQLTNQIRQEEQTQEIKLGDTLPDVGKVLGAWGQVLLRGKQWNPGNAMVSGGVMAWVLYAPEDGSQEQCLETWIPFQVRWDQPQTQQDGYIVAACNLKSIDARSVSARKIMVRACVSVMGQTYEPMNVAVYEPGEMETDVQILEKNYPVLIPKEAGEKLFELEEDLRLPQSMPQIDRIICYDLQPELVDQKVMAGKVVFRGTALLHLLYCGADGHINSWDFEVPFSQYGDLDREFEQEAEVKVLPAVTGLELENADGVLKLHASFAAQYLVWDRPVLRVVEDAYSNQRQVSVLYEAVELPAVLDNVRNVARAETPVPPNCAKILDVSFAYDQPRLRRGADQVLVDLAGTFQVLYLDEQQHLQCGISRWENTLTHQANQNVQVHGMCQRTGRPQTGNDIANDLAIEFTSMSETGLSMVSALELGGLQQPDPDRPSLVLRRIDGSDLWDVAKSCGSTVQAILQANGLSQEPEQGRLLLIPVL